MLNIVVGIRAAGIQDGDVLFLNDAEGFVRDRFAARRNRLEDAVSDQDMPQVVEVAGIDMQQPIGATHDLLGIGEDRAMLLGNIAYRHVVGPGYLVTPASPGGVDLGVVSAYAESLVIDAQQDEQRAGLA